MSPRSRTGLQPTFSMPWRDWLAELATMGSVVRDDVEKLGFALPSGPVHLYVVPKIHVRFRLVDGSYVVPSDEWVGPELFHDSQRPYLRAP